MTGYSLDYVLDNLSLPQLMMIHGYGFNWEETKSIILVNKIAECFFGAKGKKKSDIGDKPDIAKFRRVYGNKIKTKKDLNKNG